MPESLEDIKKRVQQKLITPNYSKAIVLNPNEVSQYDDKFIIPLESDWRAARQEEMAQTQSGLDQLANGVVKGAALAGTTFADTFGGTIFGLANMVANGNEQGYLNAFVNNPFSNTMQDWNEAMESNFANYRTKAERDAGLLDQMFDGDKAANFWGDMFIKNMGFAGGAMAAGMVTGKLFGAMTQGLKTKKEVELFNKMTKSLATGEASSVDEAIKILQQAPELAETSAAEIKSMLEIGARTSRNLNRANQIISSALAATGEARIEALGNGRQFYEANKANLDKEYIDPETGQVIAGKEAEYASKLESLNKNVQGFQNAEFLWNTALLTASNYVGYRDMFAKNYALNAKRFSNNIKINSLDKIANNELASFIKPKWYQTVGKSLASANREGAEEFFQGVVQKSAEDYYTSKFKGTKEGGIADMVNSIGQGLSASMNQEGLTNYILGALTGLVMPGANVYSAYKEADLESKEAQDRVANINKAYSEYVTALKQDPTRTIINFQEMINRSTNLDKAQQQALLNGDKYNYESLKHEKFFNLANAFIKAGKTEELTTMLTDESKLSVDDIRNKYSTPVDPADPSKGKKDFFDKWSDQEVQEYIRKQTTTNLAAIEDLKSITEDLESMFGEQIAQLKDGDKVTQIAVKDILARNLYLGKTLDKRITDLHTELSKHVTESLNDYTLDTVDGFAITSFLNELPKTTEEFTLDGYNKIIKQFKEAAEKTIKSKDLIEKFIDYIQLVNERKATNSAFIRLTKNNFTDLLTTLDKKDKQAEAEIKDEESKALSDEAKLNIVAEKSRKAGYVTAEGKPYTGNFFYMMEKGKKVMYEVEPSNISDIRKQNEAEKNEELEGLDPITDAQKIKEIEAKYKDNLQNAISEGKSNGAFIKRISDGTYLKNTAGTPQRFNKEFATANFDKIQFLPKEEAFVKKLQDSVRRNNQNKIKALEAVIASINLDIDENFKRAGKILEEKTKLLDELKFQKEYLEVTDNVLERAAVESSIKELEDTITQLEAAQVEIKQVHDKLKSQREDIKLLVTEIQNSFKDATNFSIEQFLANLDEMNLESVDRLWAKKLSKDLEELTNTNDIDSAIINLNSLRESVQEQIRVLRKQADLLTAFVNSSIAYKNWVITSKTKDLPVWFKSKWKIQNYDNTALLLKDPKFFSRFQYIINNYAKKEGILPNEAYDMFLNDVNQVNLEFSYSEKQSLENELLVTNNQLKELEQNLIDINNVLRFNENRQLYQNIKSALNRVKIEYTNIVNRDRKNERNTLSPSQLVIDDSLAPKGIFSEKTHAELESNALSDHLFYTTNKVVEYDQKALRQEGKYKTEYDEDGYPKLNSNKDAIIWNNFLERNNQSINTNRYLLKAFLLSDSKIPTDLKKSALLRISEGGGTHNPDLDIVTVFVDASTGEYVKVNDEGKIDSTGTNYAYTFLPKTSSLFNDNSLTKINYKALANYFKINNKVTISNIDNINSEDQSKIIKVGDKELNVLQFRELVTNFAKAKHTEFIEELKANMKANDVTVLKPSGVTNGILLTRESTKDAQGNRVSPMSPVSKVLKNKRGLDSEKDFALEHIHIHVVDYTSNYKIPGTKIYPPNAKKGAIIVYNDQTQEYFYANQRNLNTADKEVIYHLLEQVNVSDDKLSEKKVPIGNDGKNYYINSKTNTIPIFGKQGTLSLMNNILFWGSSKDPNSKNTCYIKSGKIYFANPNQGWAITTVDLDKVRNSVDFAAFLDTKRANVTRNMLEVSKFYVHPFINKQGKLEWKMYKGGYKDYLLNSKDPILITNAIDDNTKYNGNKILFASKNVILDNSNNGKPTIINSLKTNQPKPGSRLANATVAEATPTLELEDQSLGGEFIKIDNPDISIQEVKANNDLVELTVFNSKTKNTTKITIDVDGEVLAYRDDKLITVPNNNYLAVLSAATNKDLAVKVVNYKNTSRDINDLKALFGLKETTANTPFNSLGEGLEGLDKTVETNKSVEITNSQVEENKEQCATGQPVNNRGGNTSKFGRKK